MSTKKDLNEESQRLRMALSAEDHLEYFKQQLSDVRDTMCLTFPELAIDALSNSTCPLRSPLQQQPHHLQQIDSFRKEMVQKLQTVQDELEKFEAAQTLHRDQILAGVTANNSDFGSEASIRKLKETEQKIPNNHIKNRLKSIIVEANSITRNCEDLWQQLKLMYVKVSKMFEVQQNVIATEVANMHQRVVPDLAAFLKKRKELEKVLHDNFRKQDEADVKSRADFYIEVDKFLKEEIATLGQLCSVVEGLIRDFTIDEKQREVQLAKLDELRQSSIILPNILKIEMSMLTSTTPILSINIVKFQKWILGFERFFLKLCKFWAFKLPASSTTDAKPPPSAGGSIGILQIQPLMKQIFTDQLPKQTNQLHLDEEQSKQLISNYTALESKKIQTKSEIDKILNSRELQSEYEKIDVASKGAAKAYDLQTDAFLSRSNKVELREKLMQIQSDQQILSEKMVKLKPKLENHRLLVETLNQIVKKLNSFGFKDYGKKWSEYIFQEEKLCEALKQSFYNYSTSYLTFRADTRTILRSILQRHEAALSYRVSLEFEKLSTLHTQLLGQVRILANKKRAENEKLQKEIEIDQTEIQNSMKFFSEKVPQWMAQVLHEIQHVIDSTNDYIDRKTKIDWFEYILTTQKALILFTETLKLTVFDLLNVDPQQQQESKDGSSSAKDGDATIAVRNYLRDLDTMCCADNKPHGGGVSRIPVPKPTSNVRTPNNSLVWIQLAEYPERIQSINLYREGRASRRDAEQFLNARGFNGEDKSVQREMRQLEQEAEAEEAVEEETDS